MNLKGNYPENKILRGKAMKPYLSIGIIFDPF